LPFRLIGVRPVVTFSDVEKVVGFETLIAVVIKSSILWDKTPFILLKVIDISEGHDSIFRIKKKPRNKPAYFLYF
jgi:hypothetical protein